MVGEFQPALPTGPSDPFLKMFPTGEKTIRPQFRNKGDREGEHSGSSLGLHYRGVTGDELTFPGRRERFWGQWLQLSGPLTPPLSRFQNLQFQFGVVIRQKLK